METTAHFAAWVANALFAAGACGLVLLAAQLVTLRRHLRARAPRPAASRPPISILKPLCGLDDEQPEHDVHRVRRGALPVAVRGVLGAHRLQLKGPLNRQA